MEQVFTTYSPPCVVRTYLPIYLLPCNPTCLPTYLPIYLPTYLPTYLPPNPYSNFLPTYLPTRNEKIESIKSKIYYFEIKFFFVIACYWKQKIYKCKLYFNNSQFRDIECKHEELCNGADSSPYSIINQSFSSNLTNFADVSVFNLQNIQKIRKLL